MHLREGEQILRVYHHHVTPFVFQIFVALLGIAPFFLVLFLFKESFNTKWFIWAHVIIFLAYLLVIGYLALIYWLDKLVITNHRIVYVNWKYLSLREEAEAFFHEIQEIHTKEKGFLSHFRALDYGDIIVETASPHVYIQFPHAPDPEGIRRFIYHIRTQ